MWHGIRLSEKLVDKPPFLNSLVVLVLLAMEIQARAAGARVLTRVASQLIRSEHAAAKSGWEVNLDLGVYSSRSGRRERGVKHFAPLPLGPPTGLCPPRRPYVRTLACRHRTQAIMRFFCGSGCWPCCWPCCCGGPGALFGAPSRLELAWFCLSPRYCWSGAGWPSPLRTGSIVMRQTLARAQRAQRTPTALDSAPSAARVKTGALDSPSELTKKGQVA